LKTLVFDAGPVISLALNNLLWTLERLKNKSDIRFIITSGVKKEVVEKPLNTQKFKFEALQVLRLVNENVLSLTESKDIDVLTNKLLDISNRIFMAHSHCIRIVHYGEMSSLAAVISLSADALVIDERTTRLLIENPAKLRYILSRTLHTDVKVDRSALHEFQELTKKVNIIRSAELAVVSYEKGMLNSFLPKLPYPKKTLLEAVLWGVKLQGCSISRREIEDIVSIETK